MEQAYETLIQQAYAAFNRRDIPAVLLTLHPHVRWSNGWEGGYVHGHDEVTDYWTRQWKELDPRVEPIGFTERPQGQIDVEVHQVVKDVQGKLLFDGTVHHIYTIEDGLITAMELEKP